MEEDQGTEPNKSPVRIQELSHPYDPIPSKNLCQHEKKYSGFLYLKFEWQDVFYSDVLMICIYRRIWMYEFGKITFQKKGWCVCLPHDLFMNAERSSWITSNRPVGSFLSRTTSRLHRSTYHGSLEVIMFIRSSCFDNRYRCVIHDSWPGWYQTKGRKIILQTNVMTHYFSGDFFTYTYLNHL